LVADNAEIAFKMSYFTYKMFQIILAGPHHTPFLAG